MSIESRIRRLYTIATHMLLDPQAKTHIQAFGAIVVGTCMSKE